MAAHHAGFGGVCVRMSNSMTYVFHLAMLCHQDQGYLLPPHQQHNLSCHNKDLQDCQKVWCLGTVRESKQRHSERLGGLSREKNVQIDTEIQLQAQR